MERDTGLMRGGRSPGPAGATVAAVVALLVAIPGAVAQEPPVEVPAPPAPQLALPPLEVSPAGAFLRSVLVPGWGHVAIGSHSRGGFYFAAEAATAYAFLRTRRRLSEAQERAALRESVVRATLADQGTTVPSEVQAALEQDETLQAFGDLVESRRGQQEDLIAWGLFLLFLSGAVAYVSAHLARFPTPIEVQLTPVAADRAEVGLRIPLPSLH